MMQQGAGDIKHSLSGYDSEWFWIDLIRIRGIYFIFLPLAYHGEVMKLTWPEVTDTKNLRYTSRRYLCPYCTVRVSKSLDLWCVFDRLSNFEKCNLRSGHLLVMWPGGVTVGVIGSSFFKCAKLLTEQLWQIWLRFATPFLRYLRKTWNLVDNGPFHCNAMSKSKY